RAEPGLREAGGGLRLHGHPGDQAGRRGARPREDDLHSGPRAPGCLGEQGRVRVPDGARGWRQHRHDPRPPEPRDAGARREVPDGVLTMAEMPEIKKHTIAVLVENRFGVLSRVAGLFSARGYNIESLSVGETLDPAVSRMTLVVRGDAFV